MTRNAPTKVSFWQRVTTFFDRLLAVRDWGLVRFLGRARAALRARRPRLSIEELEPRVLLNAAPIAVNDGPLSVLHGRVLENIDVLANDSFAAGATIELVQGPTHGSLQQNGNLLSYSADSNYAGPDQASYRIWDGENYSNVADLLFSVENTAPTLASRTIDVHHGASFSGNLFDSASDADSDGLFATIVTQPLHGSISWNSWTGEFTLYAHNDYAGPDEFQVEISDGAAQAVATFYVNVTNSAPTLATRIIDVHHGASFTGTLFDTTSDVDNDGLFATIVAQPQHGWITWNTYTGEFTLSANTDYAGPDEFQVQISDGAAEAVATFYVNVTNAAPTLASRTITVHHGATFTGNLFDTAADADNDGLFATILTQPQHGWVYWNTYTGDFTLAVHNDYAGPDQFQVEISDGAAEAVATFYVNITNNPPTADNLAVTTDQNTSASVTLTGTDPDGDSLSFGLIDPPPLGTATITGDLLTFDPGYDFQYLNLGESETISLTYNAIDVTGGASLPATVTITVTGVNDPITADPDQAFSVDENSLAGTLVGVIAATDPDADDVRSFVLLDGNLDGAFALDGATGTIVVADASVLDFEFQSEYLLLVEVTDFLSSALVLVTIYVNDVNEAPTPADDFANTLVNTPVVITPLANDTDPESSPLTVSSVSQGSSGVVTLHADQTITYTPTSDYAGVDYFDYTVTDGTFVVTAHVLVTVLSSGATIDNESYTVHQGQALNTFQDSLPSVLANDSAPIAPYVLVSELPANGSLTLNLDGHFVYQPYAGFVGADEFSYVLMINGVSAGTGHVSLTVTNEAPVAQDDSYETGLGVSLDSMALGLPGLLFNDTDADADSLVIVSHTEPAYGQLFVFGDGHFLYVPVAGYTGPDSFEYTVSDGAALASALVSITVSNQAPVAQNDSYTLSHDQPLDTYFADLPSLFDDDVDPEGGTLSLVGYSTPLHGSLTVYSDGHFYFVPEAGYAGPDAFDYTVADALGQQSSATASLTISNQLAELEGESFTVAQGHRLDSVARGLPSLFDNDSDPDGDGLTLLSYTQPASGSVAIAPSGSFIFQAAADFLGDVSFSYTLSDGINAVLALVTITVVADASGPTAVADSYVTFRNQAIDTAAAGLASLLDNDANPDEDYLWLDVTILPQNGSLTWNDSGNFVYQPADGFTGTDTFTYEITDGAASSSATVTIDVVNRAPSAGDFTFTTLVGQTLSASLLTAAATPPSAGPSDPDGDLLTFVLVSGPTNGTLTFRPDGTFDYEPGPDLGADSFTYKVSDGDEDSPVATVNLETVQVVTWTGAGDGVSWHDADNWDVGLVPNQYCTAVIPQGLSATIYEGESYTVLNVDVQGTLENLGGLTVRRNSSVTGHLTSTGQLTVRAAATLDVPSSADLSGAIALEQNAQLLLRGAVAFGATTTTGPGLIVFRGASFSIDDAVSAANARFEYGVMSGTANYTVTQSFLWQGGTIGGSGLFRVAAGALMTIDDSNYARTLSGRTLEIAGSVDWVAGDITTSGSRIENLATGVVTAYDGGTLSGDAAFNNAGEFDKIEGDGSTVIQAGNFTNSGTVSVSAGVLEFRAPGLNGFSNNGQVFIEAGLVLVAAMGTSTGQFTVTGADGELSFALEGPAYLRDGASISSVGIVSFNSGIIEVSGYYESETTIVAGGLVYLGSDSSSSSVLLTQGKLSVQTRLDVNQQFEWEGGELAGDGQLTIRSSAIFCLGGGDKTWRIATVTNEGRCEWISGNIIAPTTLLPKTFSNRGTFDIICDNTWTYYLGSITFTINNFGRIVKRRDADSQTQGDGLTTLERFDVNNYGSIEVHSGTLRFRMCRAVE